MKHFKKHSPAVQQDTGHGKGEQEGDTAVPSAAPKALLQGSAAQSYPFNWGTQKQGEKWETCEGLDTVTELKEVTAMQSFLRSTVLGCFKFPP